MKLSPPKNITFWIAVGLGILGGIAVVIPAFKDFALLLVTAGFILLLLGNIFNRL